MIALQWQPAAPMIAVALATCALALLALRHMRARRQFSPALALQLVGMVLLALILAGPMRSSFSEAPVKPRVVLLVDDSQSMAIADGDVEGGSRLDALRQSWLDPEFLSRLVDALDIETVVIQSPPRVTPRERIRALRGESPGTPLRQAFELAISAAGEGGRVLALTDGIETTEDERELRNIGNRAAAASVRIDTVVPGAAATVPNVRLAARAEPPTVFAGQASELVIDVFASAMSGAAEVIVRQNGSDGAALAHESVALSDSLTLRIPVQPREDADATIYHVSIEAPSEDAVAADNVRDVVVHVLRDAVRVIVLEARPYWESAFLIEALRHDPQIDVTSVTALTHDREIVRTSGDVGGAIDSFDPTSIVNCDVLVLGRGVERWFGGARAALLHDFVVDQGGAMVLLRGDPVIGDDADSQMLRSVIANLSPVEFASGVLQGGVLGVTDSGREAAAISEDSAAFERALADAPGVLATMRTNAEKALSVVWLRRAPEVMFSESVQTREDDPPALAMIRVGHGRVVSVLAEGMWRWALTPEPHGAARAMYVELWRRLTRWLALGGEFAPGKLLNVRMDASLCAPNEPVSVTIRARHPLLHERPRVAAINPLGEQTFLLIEEVRSDATAWRATFTPTHEGVHTIIAEAVGEDAASAHIAVYEHRRERLDTQPRRELMQRIAEDSGGELWALDASEHFLPTLDQRARAIETEDRRPAWDHPLLFGAALAVFGAGWLLDRRERGG